VKEAERERLCNIKKEIEEEEKKIRRIKQKKDLEIQMGRKLALSTAELRKEIRLVKYIYFKNKFKYKLFHFLVAVRNWICLPNDDEYYLV